MKKFLTIGINPGITNEEYHADTEYLSSSKLKTLLESVAKFREEQLNPSPSTGGAHLELGTYVHSLILEPDLVASEYATFQGFRRAGNAFEIFKLQNPHKKLISLSMENQGMRMLASMDSVPSAKKLLKGCQFELSLAAIVDDVPVKARFDAINPDEGYIVDIKTSRETAGKEYFKDTIKQFHYDLSAALYCAVAESYYKKPFKFYWVVLAKTEPPETRAYLASDKTMAKGAREVQQALEKYKKCMASGIWLDEPAPERATIVEIEEI